MKPPFCSAQSPQTTQNSPTPFQNCSLPDPKPQPVSPSSHDSTFPSQVKEEVIIDQAPESTMTSTDMANPTQSATQAPTQPTPQKSQVVLLVKKDDRPQEDRLARKRPRSSSLDVSLNTQTSMMPPPFKKVCA